MKIFSTLEFYKSTFIKSKTFYAIKIIVPVVLLAILLFGLISSHNFNKQKTNIDVKISDTSTQINQFNLQDQTDKNELQQCENAASAMPDWVQGDEAGLNCVVNTPSTDPTVSQTLNAQLQNFLLIKQETASQIFFKSILPLLYWLLATLFLLLALYLLYMIMNNRISKESWARKRWVKAVAILSLLAFVFTFVIFFFTLGNPYNYDGTRLAIGTRLANSALPALSYLFFLPFVILIAVLLRAFFCWLFKINKIVSLLEEIKAANKETKM